MPQTSGFKVYSYRWIVLVVYMFIIIMNQLMWINFAAITSLSKEYYRVDDISIGILSMSFMIVYIFVSIPASWIIDRFGIKTGIGIGAVLTGVFGIARALAGKDYTLLLIMQIGIAIGQPFLLNAITKTAALWFPVKERATASGLGTLAMYVGVLVSMLLTPYMVNVQGMAGMLMIYGIVSLVAAIIFLVFAKEKPPTPPCTAELEERSLVLDGMKETIRNRHFIWLFIVFFIGLGVFNSVTTWIEDIVKPRGFTAADAGLTGGLMIIGGILGALIMPYLSDRFRKRKYFVLIALAGAVAGLGGITFATGYFLLMASSFVLGFFLLSAGPIGFQYGAELTYPVSEGTSNGLLLLAGQISGIGFIFGMEYLKNPVNASMQLPLVIMIALMILSFFMALLIPESPFMTKEKM